MSGTDATDWKMAHRAFRTLDIQRATTVMVDEHTWAVIRKMMERLAH
jgi:hypothetical protein